MRTSIIRTTALASLLLASACGREHLSPAFGRAEQEAFRAQHVRPPDRPAPPPNMALDTQESGAIAHGYVRSLAGKTGKGDPEPVLYIAPQQGGAAPQRLAPSVPKD